MASRKNRRQRVRQTSTARPAARFAYRLRLPQDVGWGLAVAALLAAAVWAVYGRAIHAPLMFDDSNSVIHNPSVARLWPLVGDSDVPGPLNPQREFCTAGRPLVNLSLAVNYHFSRYDSASYHIFNIVVHVFSALLLWAILRRTLRLQVFQGRFERVAGVLAFLVALVWALHPLQTEAVEYITQRTELMMAFFYLATLYASLRFWAATSLPGRATWLALAALACLAGMACKEVMVSAPVMVLLFERTFVTGSFRRALADSWRLYLALSLGWLLLLALNIGGSRAETAGFGLSVPAHVWWFTQTKALLMYLKLCVWPWPLVIHYELSRLETFGAAWPWVLPVALLGLLTLLLVWRRTAAGYALTWMFAILSPTLVVPIITENAAERRMYLSLAALVALAVVGAYELARRMVGGQAPNAGAASRPGRPLVIVVAVTLPLAFVAGAVSAHRVAVYNDPLQLWQDALAHQPDSPLVRINLGITLMTSGRAEEAIPHFEEAIRIKPYDGGTHNNLGFCLIKIGRPQEALGHIEQAIERSPDSAEAQNNMGLVLTALGRTNEAVEHFEQALELKPSYADAQVNLGVALGRLDRPQDAISHLEQALRIEPDHADAFNPLLSAYMALGQPADAIAIAERALQVARSQGRTEDVNQYLAWLAEQRGTTARP
jgi:tetratricopeptide (TPR) repeat protein